MQHLTFSRDAAPLSYTYLNIIQLFPMHTERIMRCPGITAGEEVELWN